MIRSPAIWTRLICSDPYFLSWFNLNLFSIYIMDLNPCCNRIPHMDFLSTGLKLFHHWHLNEKSMNSCNCSINILGIFNTNWCKIFQTFHGVFRIWYWMRRKFGTFWTNLGSLEFHGSQILIRGLGVSVLGAFPVTVCPRSLDPSYIVSYYKKGSRLLGHAVVRCGPLFFSEYE